MKTITTLLLFFVSLLSQAQNSPAPINLVDVILAPNHSDWNYNCGEKAKINVSILRSGNPVPNVEISYEYGPEMLPREVKETIKLEKGTGTINMGTRNTPGFRQLIVKAKVDGKIYRNQVKVAFSPDLITATNSNPSNFDLFWKEAIENARKTDLDIQSKLLPEYCTETIETYLVSLKTGYKNTRIYGYLSKPKAEGKYPVLFCPPGAGVKHIDPYLGFAEKGYISFTIEIHGINPLLEKTLYKELSQSIGSYTDINLDDKDLYYYKKVYLGCVRSIDYLCSLPEFDGKNVQVTGGSQGGALTIITAALNDKVTAIAAFYPALCDLSGFAKGSVGGWPKMFRGDDNFSKQRLETTAYYDVVNFARRINVPGFYSWGYNDNTCCPTSIYAAYNVISAYKEKHITPISGHWRFSETNALSLEFLQQHLEN